MLSKENIEKKKKMFTKKSGRKKLKPVFPIRISLNADPEQGFYLNADPDSGFWIPDPDTRSFCPKIKIKGKFYKISCFLTLFLLFDS